MSDALTRQAGNRLRVQNDDGSLLLFVSTALPDHIRKTLRKDLEACFGNEPSLVQTDSRLRPEGETNSFQVLHFSWYNRHATKVSCVYD